MTNLRITGITHGTWWRVRDVTVASDRVTTTGIVIIWSVTVSVVHSSALLAINCNSKETKDEQSQSHCSRDDCQDHECYYLSTENDR